MDFHLSHFFMIGESPHVCAKHRTEQNRTKLLFQWCTSQATTVAYENKHIQNTVQHMMHKYGITRNSNYKYVFSFHWKYFDNYDFFDTHTKAHAHSQAYRHTWNSSYYKMLPNCRKEGVGRCRFYLISTYGNDANIILINKLSFFSILILPVLKRRSNLYLFGHLR